MFNAISQVVTVTWLGLRTIGQRLGSSLATVSALVRCSTLNTTAG